MGSDVSRHIYCCVLVIGVRTSINRFIPLFGSYYGHYTDQNGGENVSEFWTPQKIIIIKMSKA